MGSGSDRRQALAFSYLEGSLFAVMVGMGESYALIFAAKVNFTAIEYGLLNTLPISIAAILTAIIPARLSSKSLKRGILISGSIQALGFLGVFLATLMPPNFIFLVTALSLYWCGGMLVAPLWLDWMSGWLPDSKLRPFLARRGSFVTLITLVSFLASAHFIFSDESMSAFAWSFGVAFVARVASLILLSLQKTPPPVSLERDFPMQTSKLFEKTDLLAILVVAVLFKFAAATGSSYFAPYKLNELGLSVQNYSWLSSLTFVSRTLLLFQWGATRQPVNTLVAMQSSMFGIAFVSIAYALMTSLFGIGLLDFASGIFWGAFDLAVVLLIQSSFKGNARAIVGIHVACMSFASLFGSTLGGWLLPQLQSYQELFAISGALRFGVGLIFLILCLRISTLKLSKQSYRETLLATLSIRPTFELISRIVPLKRRISSS